MRHPLHRVLGLRAREKIACSTCPIFTPSQISRVSCTGCCGRPQQWPSKEVCQPKSLQGRVTPATRSRWAALISSRIICVGMGLSIGLQLCATVDDVTSRTPRMAMSPSRLHPTLVVQPGRVNRKHLGSTWALSPPHTIWWQSFPSKGPLRLLECAADLSGSQ